MASKAAKRFGEFLRDLRGGRRQEDVAAEIGVQPTSISNWENGRSSPNDRMLASLLQALGVEQGSVVWSRARDLYTPHLSGHDDATDATVTP